VYDEPIQTHGNPGTSVSISLRQCRCALDKCASCLIIQLGKLSSGYLSHRYGETGAHSSIAEIISLVDELALNLRHNAFTRQIYIPDKLKEEFLFNSKHFGESDLTSQFTAQWGLPGGAISKI
jgi:hypothetical protein